MRGPVLLVLSLCGAALAIARPLAAQGAAAHIAAGDSAMAALQPAVALQHYQAALAIDSTSYDALWRAALAQVDVAKQIPGATDDETQRRDSLYADAHRYAEAAVRTNPNDAQGHFTVALALGRLSLTKGSKERVRYAKIIYDEATRAVELDSTHDNAFHILGAWHAEVKRLSGLQRFFAKALFGGGFMDRANWDDAVKNLERAVALEPQHIYHRLELAEVYYDLGQFSKAREQLAVIPGLPIGDVLDPQYKHEAAAFFEDIKNEKDRTN
ncbi:MAG: tetratricopeptide repeat protein [Gemmatimonadales bacterium]